MEADHADDLRRQANREKQRVAAASLAAAIVLTGAKLAVGLWTNSLGILSEAAHSGLDLVATGMTLWAVRMAAHPADRQHTYGHEKFENLSALFETALLVATCLWIVYESVHRLFFAAEVEVTVNFWAFLVVIGSIPIDYSRSRALGRAARKHQSQALEADALHFSTDIWSSVVVLVGLAGVGLAGRLGAPWLAQADSVAALGVAAIVTGVSLRLGKKSIDDLLDTVPAGLQARVANAARAVPGVEQLGQVRVRRSGPKVFADITLSVHHATTLEKSHEVADQAENAVRAVLPAADVVVHVEPAPGAADDFLTTVRAVAARHGLGAHGIRLLEQEGRRALELHLEVAERLTLDEAHRQVSACEEELRRALPGIDRIVTHIEPAGEDSSTVPSRRVDEAEVRRAIADFLRTHAVDANPHDLNLLWTSGELSVSFHCALRGDTAITAAHDFTVELEKHLRARVPKIGRVVIHAEPEGE